MTNLGRLLGRIGFLALFTKQEFTRFQEFCSQIQTRLWNFLRTWMSLVGRDTLRLVSTGWRPNLEWITRVSDLFLTKRLGNAVFRIHREALGFEVMFAPICSLAESSCRCPLDYVGITVGMEKDKGVSGLEKVSWRFFVFQLCVFLLLQTTDLWKPKDLCHVCFCLSFLCLAHLCYSFLLWLSKQTEWLQGYDEGRGVAFPCVWFPCGAWFFQFVLVPLLVFPQIWLKP